MADHPKITRSDADKAFEKFHNLASKLVAVPKAAIDKAEAAYQKRKQAKKRRKSG